jgi:hypothetical protein
MSCSGDLTGEILIRVVTWTLRPPVVGINHSSASERLLLPVEVRHNEIAEFYLTGRKVAIVDPPYP